MRVFLNVIFIVFFFYSCKQHVCPPPTIIITKTDTVVRPIIDTLVIIQTYDSVPEPKLDTISKVYMNNKIEQNWLRPGGWYTQPAELFKDGKRCDTIWRHTIIYY